MADVIKEKKVFEEYSIPKAVMTLAIPTIITQLINIVYNLADTWFVGRTGNPSMVAALSVVMPLYIIMSALANLFGIGGASVISRNLGMKNYKKAKATFAFCFYGGIMAAFVYMVVFILFRTPLIYLVGGDKDSFPYIYDYIFWTMIVGAIPTVGNVLCGHLVRSIGAAKEAAFGMSMGAVLNIILDPLFMFVILPKGHEVTGAAVATLISNTIALIYYLILLVKNKDNGILTINPKDISFKDNIPSEVIMVGLPAALATTLAMVSNMVANALVKPYGNAAVAGMGVAKKINTFAFNICMGLTQGVLPLIGYSYGAKNYDRLRKTVKFTSITAISIGSVCFIMFKLFNHSLISFFIDEAESVSYGTMFLGVIAYAAPLCSMCYMFNAVFQATGKKYRSFLLSTIRKGLVDIPLMFLLSHLIGVKGVVYATPITECISIFVAVGLYWAFIRKEIIKQND